MFYDVYADFRMTTLDNGLTVYSKTWPNASWFYAEVVVHAGAREDPPGREGMAHLVEHLTSENVAGLTFSQITKRFEALGGYGWFGGTSYLATKYTFHLPDERRNIHEALTLFGQMLLQGRLTHKIEEEKMVILREYHRKYEHTLARTWALQGRPFLFEHHPRLKSFASAIGIPDEFLLSTQEQIQAFYDAYYVPKNMSLVCIGAISGPDLLPIVLETPFSLHKAGQRNIIPGAFAPQPPQKHEQVIHTSEFSTLAQSKAVCTFEWVIPLHFTRQCVRMLCDMLEEALTEELRYKRSLTYDVSVDYEYYQDCRTVHVHFEIPPDAVETAKDILWQRLHATFLAQERFLEAKKERMDCIYRMDYSGYDLLEAVTEDLEGYHRLISFTEELQQVERTHFSDVLALADYLTPERAFCFVMLP